jgi:hypothetical protein
MTFSGNGTSHVEIAMTSRSARSALISIAFVSIAACGGGGAGGGASAPPNTPVDASPGGIWSGIDSVSGQQMLGLVTEQGEAHFIRADDVQYTGTATTSNNSISATLVGVTPAGYVFPDGSNSGTGTVSGTIQERQSISATVSFTTSTGLSDTGAVSLSYHPLYGRDSSLPTIAGNYIDLSTGTVVNIAAGGVIFSQDPASGCVVNGQVSIVDARYNAYRIQWTYESCMGQSSFLNGLTFSGLATLDNTGSPEYGIAGATPFRVTPATRQCWCSSAREPNGHDTTTGRPSACKSRRSFFAPLN